MSSIEARFPSEAQKNKLWQTYRSFYLSLKRKLQDYYINEILAENGKCNACIGKEVGAPLKKYDAAFRKTITFEGSYFGFPQNISKEVSIYPYLPDYHENSSTFCGVIEPAWATKQARFIGLDNLYDSSADPNDELDEQQEDANYQGYVETGKCPLAP